MTEFPTLNLMNFNPENNALNTTANVSESTTSVEHRKKSSSLATRIMGWTNNLIATSVVIIIALAVGNQLVQWWSPNKSTTDKPNPALASWPTMDSCVLAFGDSPYQLIRQQTTGNVDAVFELLIEKAKTILNSSLQPIDPVGSEESKMIADAQELSPVAESPGKWRIFKVEDPMKPGFPMVIGLRDNCKSENGEPPQTRMVVWGIGLTGSQKNWTTFTCYADPDFVVSRTADVWPIPPGCNKALSVTGTDGATLLSFVNGDQATAQEFYLNWASQNQWSHGGWLQNGSGWNIRLKPEHGTGAIEIQLTLDPDEKLRGLVVVEPNTKSSKEFAQ